MIHSPTAIYYNINSHYFNFSNLKKEKFPQLIFYLPTLAEGPSDRRVYKYDGIIGLNVQKEYFCLWLYSNQSESNGDAALQSQCVSLSERMTTSTERMGPSQNIKWTLSIFILSLDCLPSSKLLKWCCCINYVILGNIPWKGTTLWNEVTSTLLMFGDDAISLLNYSSSAHHRKAEISMWNLANVLSCGPQASLKSASVCNSVSMTWFHKLK